MEVASILCTKQPGIPATVFKRTIPLHPDIALPLYRLIPIMDYPMAIAPYYSSLDLPIDNYKIFFNHEWPDEDGWKDLRPGAAIGRIEPPTVEETQTEFKRVITTVDLPTFIPRYRIVVYLNPPPAPGLYHIS